MLLQREVATGTKRLPFGSLRKGWYRGVSDAFVRGIVGGSARGERVAICGEGRWFPFVPVGVAGCGGGGRRLFCSSSGERLLSSSFRLADVMSLWVSIVGVVAAEVLEGGCDCDCDWGWE